MVVPPVMESEVVSDPMRDRWGRFDLPDLESRPVAVLLVEDMAVEAEQDVEPRRLRSFRHPSSLIGDLSSVDKISAGVAHGQAKMGGFRRGVCPTPAKLATTLR